MIPELMFRFGPWPGEEQRMNALSNLWTAVAPSISLATTGELLSLGAFALLAACAVALWYARDPLDNETGVAPLGPVQPHRVAP
jgi:hypothetical protein